MKALQLDADWEPRAGYFLSELQLRERRADNSTQVYRNPRLNLVDLPVPEPGPGQIVARVRASGICGSDLHLYEHDEDGYVLNADPIRPPIVLGHEWSGVVESVGPGVTTLRPGDPVCAEAGDYCTLCAPCRAGLTSHCENLVDTGFGSDGAFADYVRVPERACWSLKALFDDRGDSDDTFVLGALVETLGVAYNALFVQSGGFAPGGIVAVFGAGSVGLANIAMARAAGAARILAFDILQDRRDLALAVGADQVYDSRDLSAGGKNGAAEMRALTGGIGLHMAVEAAGASPWTFPLLDGSMAAGGKIVQVGIGNRPTPVNLIRMQQQGVNLYGCMGESGHGVFPAVIRMLAARRLEVLPIVTARYPISRGLEAFTRAAQRIDGKVMLLADG